MPIPESIISTVKSCRLCEAFLPLGPNPIFSVHPKSKILIIGQAPGTKVHATGIPWNDASGEELRRWMGVDKVDFYNPTLFGIMPMGFCYPGRGKSGDLPPRQECAPSWHGALREMMPEVRLTLLIGQYAQRYYLGIDKKATLTETVREFRHYLPGYFPLVHPSPRNRLWQRRNPWFEELVVPELRARVAALVSG